MFDRFRYFFRASAIPFLDVPRVAKRVIVLLVDVCLCLIATWIAFFLRLGEFVEFERLFIPTLVSVILAIPIFVVTGFYRAIFRHAGWPAIISVAQAIVVYGLFFSSVVTVVGLQDTPRTVGIIQPLVLFLFLDSQILMYQGPDYHILHLQYDKLQILFF